ncbi:serine protease SPPA, chloroplastic-like [Coffea arabica]|uniref:Serine protease SPPA, chloroplastic-like n=1 Tax=Coffea arabica TaxID=13443 RepID=A0A6P6TBP6_COFAR|nr:serine protease SPPA, chloroplastic-like [Coffea arabica]
MWREIRLLADSKPVVASMADVAASGGYYTAMGTGIIVAENLTLTGSIGVVTDLFSSYGDEFCMSRNQLDKRDNDSTRNAWPKSGVITALLHAIAVILTLDKFRMQDKLLILDGKTGAVDYADLRVTLVELVKPSPSLPEILTGIGNSLVGADRVLKQLLDELAVSDGIQARMDGIMFQKLEGADYSSPILTMVKDYLGSL